MGCDEGELIWKETIDLEGLGISMHTLAESNFVKLLSANPCFAGGSIDTFNLGSDRRIDCEKASDGYWIVTYLEYINQYKIKVKACFHEGETPPKACYEHTTQSACQSAGCYWYQNSCHSSPEPEEPDDLTDYDRIETGMRDALVPVIAKITGVESLVGGVSDKVSSFGNSLTSQIEEVRDGITGLIDSLDTKLSGMIDGVSETLSNAVGALDTKLSGLIDGVSGAMSQGFDDVSNQIGGLKIPTIESIKQGFLDVCSDLALALWDCIIDKIEERYPDDDKE